MRSLLGGVAELITVRNKAAGWSSTTYSTGGTSNPFAKGNRKGTTEMEAYASVSTLFAVVSKIANSTGSVKWRLYSKQKDGRRVNGPAEDNRTEKVSHVALDLWENPNEAYTQSRMVESIQQHVDLCGEARILIARSDRSTMPLELWPIRPDKIEPVPSADGPLLGYVYTGPNDEKIPLQPDEVIDIIMPNPMDPYRGLGPVQTLLTDLGATKAAAQWNANFFANDATPGGIIEMEENLSDSEWHTFVERWRDSHQGVGNAHRVATLEKAKWVNAQFTMRDMQFTELREYSDKTIMATFGMSPHMLGIEETVNRATAEAAEDVFARWVIKPRLDRIKDALNSQLLPLFGTSTQGLEFDFDDPSLEDSEANDMRLESKARAAKLLIEAGGKFESVLENVGLPKIEFDQEKIDRETKLKEEAEKSKQKALESGNGNSPDQIPSKPKESARLGERGRVIHNGFKTARPLARLQAGRTDWYRIENSAENGAEIYIYDEIGYVGVSAKDFVKDLNAIKTSEITLHLDTPGGDVYDGITIYNAIRDHKSHVTVVVDSMAAICWQLHRPGRRQAGHESQQRDDDPRRSHGGYRQRQGHDRYRGASGQDQRQHRIDLRRACRGHRSGMA